MSDLTATNCGYNSCNNSNVSNGFGGSCIWIILLLFCCGGNGNSNGCGGGILDPGGLSGIPQEIIISRITLILLISFAGRSAPALR